MGSSDGSFYGSNKGTVLGSSDGALEILPNFNFNRGICYPQLRCFLAFLM